MRKINVVLYPDANELNFRVSPLIVFSTCAESRFTAITRSNNWMKVIAEALSSCHRQHGTKAQVKLNLSDCSQFLSPNGLVFERTCFAGACLNSIGGVSSQEEEETYEVCILMIATQLLTGLEQRQTNFLPCEPLVKG